MKVIVGITGASGSIYAKKLIVKLSECDNIEEVAVVPTGNSLAVWKQELSEDLMSFLRSFDSNLKVYSNDDFFTSPASGSSGFDAMIIIPCSMATLAKVANGISNTLITRAADVMLKERKKLLLAVREAPYNLIHIENMKKVTLAGGIIFPLSPVFYNYPGTIDDLVIYSIERILNVSSICNEKTFIWKK